MWENRIVGYDELSPHEFLANPQNWRIHSAFQQDAVSAVLDDLGWVKPVIVNRHTQHVVDGHLRIMLALQAERAFVPVLYVDLSEEEERRALATLDPLAGLATADAEVLAPLLEGFETENRALAEFLRMQALEHPVPDTPTPKLEVEQSKPRCPRCGYPLDDPLALKKKKGRHAEEEA